MFLLLSVFKPPPIPMEYKLQSARIFVCFSPRWITSAKPMSGTQLVLHQVVVKWMNWIPPNRQAVWRRAKKQTTQTPAFSSPRGSRKAVSTPFLAGSLLLTSHLFPTLVRSPGFNSTVSQESVCYLFILEWQSMLLLSENYSFYSYTSTPNSSQMSPSTLPFNPQPVSLAFDTLFQGILVGRSFTAFWALEW